MGEKVFYKETAQRAVDQKIRERCSALGCKQMINGNSYTKISLVSDKGTIWFFVLCPSCATKWENS